ncbi:metallophosphoesterase [uncultured Lamprocystis sp.]|jgi:Icc protein|uniref:metallophosphoesterase n=1 Tax=uncultured Lamprocystis sp. TaxID=543132 RepID=UPI0025F6976A|nr:metallophosphoesterase [uncultured Lamprocystis sp.]
MATTVSAPSVTHQDRASTQRDETPRPADDSWRLIQITDSHLFAAADARLLDLNTRRSFAAVLALALEHAEPAAALVMTGDLVHDESAAGYAYLAQALGALGCPCFCIPGNHDRRGLMETWLGASAIESVAERRLGTWNLIFLDSTQPGKDGGQLTPRQVAQVETLLQRNPGPTLVFLHQHPIPVGSDWIDTIDVANGAELLAVCDRHPQVKAIVCGHIHQEFASVRRHYQILGTPSTCFQFMPGSPVFALDARTPGYRELRLHADGRLDSWVVRLAEYPEPLVYSTIGY